MSKHFNWDRVVAVASWVIVLILAYGAAYILLSDLNPNGPIVQLLGVTMTRVVFVTMYSTQAFLLGYAKVKKKDTMRRHALLFIYLSGFFLSILGFYINGFSIRVVSNVVLSTCAAVCWLYWKLRTDYLSHEEMRDYGKEVA